MPRCGDTTVDLEPEADSMGPVVRPPRLPPCPSTPVLFVKPRVNVVAPRFRLELGGERGQHR